MGHIIFYHYQCFISMSISPTTTAFTTTHHLHEFDRDHLQPRLRQLWWLARSFSSLGDQFLLQDLLCCSKEDREFNLKAFCSNVVQVVLRAYGWFHEVLFQARLIVHEMIWLFLQIFILFYFSAMYFFIVVQVHLSPLSPHHGTPPHPSSLPTLEPTHFASVYVSFTQSHWKEKQAYLFSRPTHSPYGFSWC